MVDLLKSICCRFTRIGLDEMDKVKLMKRKEIKYTVHRNLLPDIFIKILGSYDLLYINEQFLMPYKSVYFDTRDFKLYTSHQNGKLNRYKVRSRTYELTNTEFLEIKFKNNKMRTLKSRIEIDKDSETRVITDFLEKNLPSCFRELEEKLTVKYKRIMLVDHKKTERITIDLNLRYSSFNKENAYENLAVIEIKHEGDLSQSAMAAVLSQMNIKSASFSKYCLGIFEIYRNVKKNLMNIKMREIRKTLAAQSNLKLNYEGINYGFE